MTARLGKAALILAQMTLLAALLTACASAGVSAPGRTRIPVVTNPAPIVSGTMRRYQVGGRWYQPMTDASAYDEVGMASWYGDQFNGRPTATGERFDMHALTAAHKTLPLPALVEVTNLSNGQSAVLRVNDRGPFVGDRIIDLSRGAAQAIGLLSQGVGRVRVRYLGPAPRGGGGGLQLASSGAATGAGGGGATPNPRIAQSRTSEDLSRYWIQAGSFADPTLAHLAAESLGDRARVNATQVEGRAMFRVVVGPWSDANAAEQARQSIVARGMRDALLISGS